MGASRRHPVSGIFNGEMGKIEKINGILETAEISFDRKNCSI